MLIYQKLDQNYLFRYPVYQGFFLECGGGALGSAAGRYVFGL